MRRSFLILLMAILTSCAVSAAEKTPISVNGQLQVKGLQLVNSSGEPVQLRGLSTQGTQFFPWGDGPNPFSIRMAAKVMGADIYRIPTYVKEGGYHNPKARAGLMDTLDKLVNETQKCGMYCIIDWHVTSFDPSQEPYFSEAKDFFSTVINKYAGRPHVLYELCNEPKYGTPWANIKTYAHAIIPIIRAKDPDAVIIVGSPDDSGDLSFAAADPLTDSDDQLLHNVMYALHFYAGSHPNDISRFTKYANKLPIIVTEWAASSDSGDSPDCYPTSQKFADALAGANQAGVKVSWVGWSFTCDKESSAMLRSGTGPWDTSNLTDWGVWIQNHMSVKQR